ncbi:MAG: hypothetical protein INQ03_00260 [Candidatus Heimdallarchaeota archaeon]|nr:hypothetical protein [Candidatus Heimdallarchaeota archaeon]
MNLYSFFYKNIISYSPESLVEKMGGPFTAISAKFAPQIISIPFKIKNIEFQNPVGMSSGWADTPQKVANIHKLGAGVVIAKTLTSAPRKGNKRPRLIRGDMQLINSMGLPNKGVEWWKSNFTKGNHPAIHSIRGESIPDWELLIEVLENITDIFEFNFSCPNLHAGVMDLNASRKIVKDIASITTKPVFLKLSPEYSIKDNLSFIGSVDSDIAGISLINTIPVQNEKLGNPMKRGGLSGKPVHDTLLEFLHHIRVEYPRFSELPIFAMGGIMNPQQAWNVLNNFQALPLNLSAFLIKGPGIFNSFAANIVENLESNNKTLAEVLE